MARVSRRWSNVSRRDRNLLAALAEQSHDITIHFVKEFASRIPHIGVNLPLQFGLDFRELGLNFGIGAAALHRLDDFALEIDAAFDDAKHLVAGPEHAGEEAKLLVEKLVDALLRPVPSIEHVDDGHVDLLAVAVAASNSLLHPLRVPRQIEIHENRTELKIDALGAGFRRDQDRLFVAAESIDNGRLHIGGFRARNRIGPLMLFEPRPIERLALGIAVGAVHQDDLSRIAVLREQDWRDNSACGRTR